MTYTETVTIKDKKYKRTYSDTYTIERDGVEYSDAIDPMNSDRVYTETTNRIESIAGMIE